MATVRRFEDLECWRKARELTRRVYEVTGSGALARDYGLRDQLRRSAVSVMSNIAEGFERGGDREFQHFLAVARGSAGEARAQLYVALDAGYVDLTTHEELTKLAIEASSLIAGLMRYLSRSPMCGSKHRPEDAAPR